MLNAVSMGVSMAYLDAPLLAAQAAVSTLLVTCSRRHWRLQNTAAARAGVAQSLARVCGGGRSDRAKREDGRKRVTGGRFTLGSNDSNLRRARRYSMGIMYYYRGWSFP